LIQLQRREKPTKNKEKEEPHCSNLEGSLPHVGFVFSISLKTFSPPPFSFGIVELLDV
jgi:hypothetical protein